MTMFTDMFSRFATLFFKHLYDKGIVEKNLIIQKLNGATKSYVTLQEEFNVIKDKEILVANCKKIEIEDILFIEYITKELPDSALSIEITFEITTSTKQTEEYQGVELKMLCMFSVEDNIIYMDINKRTEEPTFTTSRRK